MSLENPSLMLDFYELSMSDAYFRQGRTQEWAVFDYYFRRVPDRGGYAVFAGLETFLDFVCNLHFDAEQIAFLRKKGGLSEEFLRYLADFRFRGEIYSFPEGAIIFPNEPVVSVRAPLIDCQLLETYLLMTLNHQSLVATKSSRICAQAGKRAVSEFGSRRAHGGDAALYGARAAFIGGAVATANVEAEKRFGIPAVGTMAHSFVQSFDTEAEAFATYARCYPDNCVLLIDTYDVINSGIPNAIKTHTDVLQPLGKRLKAVRIDSGDLSYLSRVVRQKLNDANMKDCQIMVSNSLDEFLIKDLISQGAVIDGFGIGERLITAKTDPVFGGVYKIVSLEKDGKVLPKIKISENTVKTTTPGFKQVWRLFDEGNMALADVVSLRDEEKPTDGYVLFDPNAPWKRKKISGFRAEPMLNLVFKDGKSLAKMPSLLQIQKYCKESLQSFWLEVKRLKNPHSYYVDLSEKLWNLKQKMLNEKSPQLKD